MKSFACLFVAARVAVGHLMQRCKRRVVLVLPPFGGMIGVVNDRENGVEMVRIKVRPTAKGQR